MKIDFKGLREKAGLTTEQLAARSGFAVSTINGLEKHGDGSQRLKDKLLELLGEGGDYVLRDQAARPDAEVWKERATNAEQKLVVLRDGLRMLLDMSADTPQPSEAGATQPRTISEIAGELMDTRKRRVKGV